MRAAFILASSGSCESAKKRQANFDLPARWRRHCGSTDVTWSERRPLKKMPDPEEGKKKASADRYECNTCDRRFVDRPGFEGRHYAEDVILFALRLVARHMAPIDAAGTVNEQKGVKVSERAIRRWVDDYPKLVATFAKDLEVKGCDVVSVDEKYYKSKGNDRWIARAISVSTRFILASDHWPDKLNHDDTLLLKKLVERLGKVSLLLLSDGLKGYKIGYRNTMKTGPKLITIHIPDASVNNRHERHNGETQRYKAGSRGYNSDEPGLFLLEEVYHNFLRPHMGLNNMTPAEKSGIHIPRPDKLLTLIRRAATARFDFAWCSWGSQTQNPISCDIMMSGVGGKISDISMEHHVLHIRVCHTLVHRIGCWLRSV